MSVPDHTNEKDIQFIEAYAESKGLTLEEAERQAKQLHPDWLDFLESNRNPSFLQLHKKKIPIVVGGLILLFLAVLLTRGDPNAGKIKAMESRLDDLNTRLNNIEAGPSETKGSGDPVADLRQIEKKLTGIEEEVQKAEALEDKERATKQIPPLKQLKKNTNLVVETAGDPVAQSGEDKMKIRKLLEAFQVLEEDAEKFRAGTGTNLDTQLLLRYEALVESIKEGIAKLAALLKSTGPGPDLEVVKEMAGRINQRIGGALERIATIKPPPPPRPIVKKPFKDDQATFIIGATSDLPHSLIVPLLKKQLEKQRIPPAIEVNGKWYIQAAKEKILIRNPIGNEFDELIKGDIHLLVSGNPPTEQDKIRFKNAFDGKELYTRDHGEVIALDALTFRANNQNPKKHLEPKDIVARNFPARQGNSPERAYAKPFGIGTAALPRPKGAHLIKGNEIHLFAYHEGDNFRSTVLPFQAAPAADQLKPSPFTIKTEDYKFSVRIIAWNIPKPDQKALELVKFATSNVGQKIVSDNNYVDNSVIFLPTVDPIILVALAKALGLNGIQGAQRLSTNIRFAFGKADFDIKALADLERLPRILPAKPKEIVILGFTDNVGGPNVNIPLSKKRAQIVADELNKARKGIVAAGMGVKFPVDTNDTDEGRAKNRRSEIWVVTP